MDELKARVLDKLIESYIEGKISFDDLKARYLELGMQSESDQVEVTARDFELPSAPLSTKPVEQTMAQTRRLKELMDKLDREIEDVSQTARSSERGATSSDRVDYLAHLAKRV
jgi:hypothetical protein